MYDFAHALRITLAFEGGKVDDPADPGGRTAFGITQTTLDAWRSYRGEDKGDVWTIGPDEVAAIYETQYWKAAGCENLSWPLSLVHFDSAVNSGGGRASKWLLAAQWADVPTQTEAFVYLTLRREHILANASQRFVRGLLNRIDGLLREVGL
jgi:lysozyme family protein